MASGRLCHNFTTPSTEDQYLKRTPWCLGCHMKRLLSCKAPLERSPCFLFSLFSVLFARRYVSFPHSIKILILLLTPSLFPCSSLLRFCNCLSSLPLLDPARCPFFPSFFFLALCKAPYPNINRDASTSSARLCELCRDKGFLSGFLNVCNWVFSHWL